jgi:hypothetical protein
MIDCSPIGWSSQDDRRESTMRCVLSLMLWGLFGALAMGGCQGAGAESAETPDEGKETATEAEKEPATGQAASALAVTSPSFEHEQAIPGRFTCDGDDLSPALAWDGVPEGAAQLVLICDDPDAPVGTWIHWVLVGLPADASGLPEGVKAGKDVGAEDGKNSWKKTGYGGPCPPKGPSHRYFFRVYALDLEADWKAGVTRKEVDAAMEGHILAEGTLMGTYARGG